MAATRRIGKKLRLILDLLDINPDVFASDFAQSHNLRAGVVRSWLDNERGVYKSSLDKIAAFFREHAPELTASHFVLPDEDFLDAIQPKSIKHSGSGMVLPNVTAAPISLAQIEWLAGSYELFRFNIGIQTIVREILTVSGPEEVNIPPVACLRAPLIAGVQTFYGSIVYSERLTSVILKDADPTSSAFRTITLPSWPGRSADPVIGMMSGGFERDNEIAQMNVAVRRLPSARAIEAPALQRDVQESELGWGVALSLQRAQVLPRP